MQIYFHNCSPKSSRLKCSPKTILTVSKWYHIQYLQAIPVGSSSARACGFQVMSLQQDVEHQDGSGRSVKQKGTELQLVSCEHVVECGVCFRSDKKLRFWCIFEQGPPTLSAPGAVYEG